MKIVRWIEPPAGADACPMIWRRVVSAGGSNGTMETAIVSFGIKDLASMKPPSVLLIFALIITLVVTAACNLSGVQRPPTIVPQVTDTPFPPITFSTLSPTQLPGQLSSAPGPAVDASLRSYLTQIEADRLFLHIDALERMGTRHVNSEDLPNQGIRAAYRYIHKQFEAIQNANFRLLNDNSFNVTWAGLESVQSNIVGIIPGTAVGGGVIVIGAHYDSVSIDPNDAAYPAPGANDNGSGVAALIEIARVLSVRQHRATILFVAFGAEEIGRQGSLAFVQFLRNQQDPIQVDAMLNMDIIGSQTGANGEIDDRRIRLFSVGPNEGSPSRQLARNIDLIDQQLDAPLDVVVQDSDTGDRARRYSDHLSFSEAGFPAVRFIESLEDRNRQHTPQDTSDDIQASYLVASTRTILTSLVALADGLPPPQNIVLREADQGKRTLVWETVPGAASYLIALRRPGGLTYDTAFPWVGNSVDWDGFVSTQFVGLVVCAVDGSGLIGPPSREYVIP